MESVKVLDNEFVSMWHYPERRIIHHQFHQHIWGTQFRATLSAGAEVFQNSTATKWLSDDRENCALSKEDSDWGVYDWFPRMHAAGWKYWAIVLPNHVIGQMNMKRFIAAYSEKGLITRVFDDPAAALFWLQSQTD